MSKIKQSSKFLSYILRHNPEKINIKLDKNGWVGIDELLEKCKLADVYITREELQDIVMLNDKQRFKISDDGTKIRASQGHTIKIDLQLKVQVPPIVLYHGTVEKSINGIMKSGLKSMTRHHLHLSSDIETATNVGSRRGKPIILEINSKAMYADGFVFYKSDNGVWLTDEVPSKYLKLWN